MEINAAKRTAKRHYLADEEIRKRRKAVKKQDYVKLGKQNPT